MASEHSNQAIATARELIAAGKKAAAEGEVMIAQRRLVSRHWECRGTRRRCRSRTRTHRTMCSTARIVTMSKPW